MAQTQRINISVDEETMAAMDQLEAMYGDRSKVIRAAVAHLALMHKPDPHPDPLARIERLARSIMSEISGEWERRGWAEENTEINAILDGGTDATT